MNPRINSSLPFVRLGIADLEDELARHPRVQQPPSQYQDLFDWAGMNNKSPSVPETLADRKPLWKFLLLHKREKLPNSDGEL